MKRFLHFIFLLVLSTWSIDGLLLQFEPFDPIPMEGAQNLTLRLMFDEKNDTESESLTDEDCVVLTFNLTNLQSWAINIPQDRLIFTKSDIIKMKPQTLALEGVIVGYNDMQVFAHIDNLETAANATDLDELPMILPEKELQAFLQSTSVPGNNTAVEGEEEQSVDPNQGGIALTDEEEVFFIEGHHVSAQKEARTLMRQQKVEVILGGGNKLMTDIFTLVITLMIVLNTVNMGGQLDIEVIKAVFKKPIGPAVGFVSQFMLMPLFAFGTGWILAKDDILFRLGLFVLGTCPGGTASNFWCILLEGDINLSITMTFISTIAALGMMPMWLYLMGPLLTEDDLVIPFGQLIMSLVSLTAPLALGMWIRYRWAKAAPVMDKIIVPFTLLTVLFFFTAGVYINLYLFKLMTPQMVASGFIVCGAGYIFGGGLAWAFRLNWAQIKAVSIETAFQNGSLAFISLKVSLPAPYGDLSTVAPVAQIIITTIPLWIMLGVFKLWQKVIQPRCFPKDNQVIEPIQEEADLIEYKQVD